MFDSLPGIGKSKELKAEEEAQKKQIEAAQEQGALSSTTATEPIDNAEQESKSDLIRWQQDLEPELMDLVYKLKGWLLIDNQWMKPDDCTPLCNDKFINKVVIPRAKPYLSRNLINSNLSEDRILKMLERTANDIADNMSDGWDIYEIDFIDYDDVLDTIKDTIIPGSFRALNGWTKKTDSTTFKKLESSFDNSKQESMKRGLFGFK